MAGDVEKKVLTFAVMKAYNGQRGGIVNQSVSQPASSMCRVPTVYTAFLLLITAGRYRGCKRPSKMSLKTSGGEQHRKTTPH